MSENAIDLNNTIDAMIKKDVKVKWSDHFIMTLFAERKTAMFAVLHFLLTITVWYHFFFEKFNIQMDKVPDEANRYWWKRLAPPLEFGAMVSSCIYIFWLLNGCIIIPPPPIK